MENSREFTHFKPLDALPKSVWANILNLYGLRFTKPVKMTIPTWVYEYERDDGHFDQIWFHKNGNDSVENLGIWVADSWLYATFASTDKDEVQGWMDGADAVFQILSKIGSGRG